jgi:hypothetical protein
LNQKPFPYHGNVLPFELHRPIYNYCFAIKKKHHNSSQELAQHYNVSYFWDGCSVALRLDQKLALQGKTQK